MNRMDRPIGGGEAKLRFLDGDYQILRHGNHVACAVTGELIPLEDLRYWSVEAQEAYANPLVASKRYAELQKAKSGN